MRMMQYESENQRVQFILVEMNSFRTSKEKRTMDVEYPRTVNSVAEDLLVVVEGSELAVRYMLNTYYIHSRKFR